MDTYTTPLNPIEEQAYQVWLAYAQKTKGPDWTDRDYDLRGYWKEAGGKLLQNDEHLTDKWKKPNHPTFSTDSIYSNAKTPGGEWQEVDGKWQFYAHPSQTDNPDKVKGLQDYFRVNEKDATLVLPPPLKNP